MSLDILKGGYLAPIAKEMMRTKQFQTPILNTFFAKKIYVENGVVATPKEVKDTDDLLPLLNPTSGIKSSEVKLAGDFNYYELKLFGDLKIVTPKDIENYKRQLQNLDPTTFQAKKVEIVNGILDRHIQRVNATREYMAGSAVLGTIKDKDGNVIYNFNIPASNRLGDFKVSDDTKKPNQVIFALKAQMKKATKYSGQVGVIIGVSAYEKLLESPSYQRYYERSLMNVEAQLNGIDGYINGKIPFIVADETYTDKAGNKKTFFNEDSILLAPTQLFAEFYTAIVTNQGSFAKLLHIDTYNQNNPDGTAIRLQTASMPIITASNSIVTATLS